MAEATAAGGRRPAVLIFTETWVRPGCSPPPLQGYVLLASSPSPLGGNGRGCGGVAVYVARDQVSKVRMWREPREGVAWVQVHGVLDRPLRIAACYIPPQLSAARLDAIYGHLTADVMDAHTSGYVAVAGDVNGRTGSACETAAPGVEGGLLQPSQPAHRVSRDCQINAQGRALLHFCGESGLWIGNGRLPGDAQGEWTFHSLANAGAASVVDYFLLDLDLIAKVGVSLVVHPPALLMDHSVVELVLPAWQNGGTADVPASDEELGPSPAGPEYKVSETAVEMFAAEAEAKSSEWEP